MNHDKTNHELILERKSQIFFEEKIIVHLKKYNGTFYNGRLFEVGKNYLKIHDREDGVLKIYFIEISSIEEFEVKDE